MLVDVQPVPFVDLGAMNAAVKARILDDVAALLDSGQFTNGPQVEEFERAFAAYCRRPCCVGVANGTDALRLALIAGGLEPGDEVLVPANTFVATFEAISQAGGVPVPVDVSERDYNLDVAAAEAALTPRTRFVVPVHLYGQLSDMHAVTALADRAGLAILEDACQAHGARRDGYRAGGSGFAAAFSFYPAKNLGAIGDAGALVLDDTSLDADLRALREHGQRQKYRHVREGFTSRLDTIQAVVLLRKLPLLEAWNAQRRQAASYYDEALAGIGDLRVPPVPAGSEPVRHLYPVRTERREALADALTARGIAVGRHYPEPPHLSAAYVHLRHREGEFPLTEALAEELLSLPLFPGITEEQLATVTAAIADFFNGG